MKVDLMGVQTINYTQKRTGKQASMCVLHTVHPRNGMPGYAVEEIRVYEGSEIYNQASQLPPASVLDIDFDSRGFVTGITVLPDAFPFYNLVADRKPAGK